jgi:hypothetical protein
VTEQTTAARLRAAFLAASGKTWPDLAWGVGSREDALLHPERSPALGALEVWFDEDEITLCFGPNGYHQHHGIYDALPTAELEVEEQRVASKVVEVIKALLADEVVVRWGLIATSAGSIAGHQGRRARWWRLATPWAREAVWSGRPRG